MHARWTVPCRPRVDGRGRGFVYIIYTIYESLSNGDKNSKNTSAIHSRTFRSFVRSDDDDDEFDDAFDGHRRRRASRSSDDDANEDDECETADDADEDVVVVVVVVVIIIIIIVRARIDDGTSGRDVDVERTRSRSRFR